MTLLRSRRAASPHRAVAKATPAARPIAAPTRAAWRRGQDFSYGVGPYSRFEHLQPVHAQLINLQFIAEGYAWQASIAEGHAHLHRAEGNAETARRQLREPAELIAVGQPLDVDRCLA
jgi:hypothetical protein